MNARNPVMAQLLERFAGDYIKALAAYHLNDAACVEDAVKRLGGMWLAGMPKATQSYVNAILDRGRHD